MRASAFDPPAIPAAFWERPDVCQALRKRDMGALFRLLHEHLGLSQTRIGTAVGLGQGRMSEVINGIRKIRDAKVFERIARGLDMPDHARVLLGLSPRQITTRTPPRSSAPASSGQDADLLRQITAAGRIDGTVVRVLQGETDNIRLLDRRLGAPTVAVRAAVAGLDPTRHQVIYVANPAFGTRGLYVQVVRALGAQPRYLKAELMAQAADLLAAETAERHRTVVLIVDFTDRSHSCS
jgi:transcriptional regulator with XRE-family HTH domain